MSTGIDVARIARIVEGVEKPPPCQEVSLAGRRRETGEQATDRRLSPWEKG